jgi:hypothetical protein
MALVDDRASGCGARSAADQELRDILQRLLRGRQADTPQGRAKQCFETLEREREMRTPLVASDRVDLVDDHGSNCREHASSGLRCHQQVERLGRRHEDVRSAAAHPGTLGRRRVAGSHERADLDVGQMRGAQLLADPFERTAQVALDVVRQGLERRDV